MLNDDHYYDSLDDDFSFTSSSTEDSELPTSPFVRPEDVVEIVPLYNGEVPKVDVKAKKQKSRLNVPTRSKRTNYPFIGQQRPNKTYLSIYHEQLNRLKGNKSFERSDIGGESHRAVCDHTSPRRHSDPDLQAGNNCGSECSSQSETEFYEKFMKLNLAKHLRNCPEPGIKQKVEKQVSTPTKLKVGSTKVKPFYFSTTVEENLNKLEKLRKRQTYGMRMSIRNRVMMEEEKTLRKIKDET